MKERTSEEQRQFDVDALTRILEAKGLPRRRLERCPRCDAYRVHGEACVMPLCLDALTLGDRHLPGVLPNDAPAWAFWLETNSVYGYVCSEEQWRMARACYPDVPVERFRAAAWQHPATFDVRVANFGLRREHTGARTLVDHAREHGLGWLT